MKIERKIDEIINDYLPAIISGNASIESVSAKFPELADELKSQLEAAVWLQQMRYTLATRPGFIHDSRRYLESKIMGTNPMGFWQRLSRKYSPQRWVFNVAAPIIITLLLVLIANSAVYTARLSIPGDTLYPAKLVLEDVRLAMTFNNVKKTDLYIQFSRQRALEFVELVLEGEYDRLPAAAGRMDTEIIASLRSLNEVKEDNTVVDHEIIANFKEVLSNEIMMLNVLENSAPPSATNGINLAISVAQSGLLALR